MRRSREITQKLPPVAGNFWLIILLLTEAAFHVAAVRQGHIWGDDLAMSPTRFYKRRRHSANPGGAMPSPSIVVNWR